MSEFYFGATVASSTPILGKPFEAEFEEIHLRKSSGGISRAYGRLSRDSSGRRRRDVDCTPEVPKCLAGAGEAFRISIIENPATGTCYFLDDTPGQPKRLQIPTPQTDALDTGQTLPKPSETCQVGDTSRSVGRREFLGSRTIEGVLCDGLLQTNESGDRTTESWLSTDLFETLLHMEKGPDIEISYRLFNMKFIEPDPSLFFVPGHLEGNKT